MEFEIQNNIDRMVEKMAMEHDFNNFKKQLIEVAVNEYNFTPKQAEIIFNKAWEDGHAFGYSEVRFEFESLIGFINVFKLA